MNQESHTKTPQTTPATGTNLSPSPQPAVPQTGGGNLLKEWVAAGLAVVIVGFTMYFMWKMFDAPDDVGKDLWVHQSTILQTAVGFAGMVIGYYFGRIPAERAAQTAQHAANSAQTALVSTSAMGQQALANENRIRTDVSDFERQMSTNTPMGGGASAQDAAALRVQVTERLRQILRSG